MKKMVHAIAGSAAMLLVATFLAGTVYAELAMDEGSIAETKRFILYGVCFLVPAMAITGGSGFLLVSRRIGGIVDAKKKRMRVIAANGLVVMLPCAICLYMLASSGNFGAAFFIVQAIEIAGGLLQLYLLGRNFRDGLKLSGRLRRLAPRNPKPAS